MPKQPFLNNNNKFWWSVINQTLALSKKNITMITLSCTRLASTKLSSSCIRLASTKISFPKLINVQEVVSDQQNWKDLFEKQEPILFKGINKNWKACNSWSDVDYLKAKVKSSSKNQAVIVPVECGDNYMDEELQILHLDFIELLDFFDKKDITNVPTLYLAQVLYTILISNILIISL